MAKPQIDLKFGADLKDFRNIGISNIDRSLSKTGREVFPRWVLDWGVICRRRHPSIRNGIIGIGQSS